MFSFPILGNTESIKGPKNVMNLGGEAFCLTANSFTKTEIRQNMEGYSR